MSQPNSGAAKHCFKQATEMPTRAHAGLVETERKAITEGLSAAGLGHERGAVSMHVHICQSIHSPKNGSLRPLVSTRLTALECSGPARLLEQ